MKLRPLGNGGPEVSAIGFGAMHLSIDGRPDELQAVKTLHAAWEADTTLIDTADAYCLNDTEPGHNERIIAKALKTFTGKTASIVIATKGGCVRPEGRWERDGRPTHLREACEASLISLNVKQIALYQLHAIDPKVPIENSVGELVKLQQEGKILRIGLSNVNVDQIKMAQRITPIATVQNRYNLFVDALIGNPVVEFCAAQGIGFLAYNPVGGRRLALELPHHPVLRRIAETHQASPHAVILAWLLAISPAIIPIPGSRTPQHARDSASASSLTLSRQDLQDLQQAKFQDPTR